MSRPRRALLTGFCLACWAAAPAIASSVLYDNGSPNQTSAYISDLTDPIQSQIIADNFTMLGVATVRNVGWWGAYAGNTPLPDNFTIEVYADASGAPGTLLYSTPVTASRVSAEFQTGISFGSSQLDVYKYSADVNFALNGSTPYWLVIYNNNTATNDLWVWATTSGTNNGSFFAQQINTWQPLARDFAFILQDTSTVPEPGTWALCGAGLLVLGARRWRRT